MERSRQRSGDDAPSMRVYTVCDESRYLIVRNVPALGCVNELIQLFASHGPIEEYQLLDEEEAEEFTDVYWIKFFNISNARFAKRKLDEFKFLGNLLQVTYAPRYESLPDIREKLEERRKTVLNRINGSKWKETWTSKEHYNMLQDPLIPSSSSMSATGQYPKLPLERPVQITQRESNIVAPDVSKNVLQHAPVTGQLCNLGCKYFSSSSMNETVQFVRNKLEKISHAGDRIGFEPEQSRKHASAEVNKDQGTPIQKKQRQDNRRRI